MTKEDFIKLAGEKWDQIAQEKNGNESFYDYEKAFDELWVEFGRLALEGSLGEVPSNRRKKKRI